MASPSRISILAALAGNVAVGGVKLFAFMLGGSSSMLVEAVHSAVDTLNQGLLLFGQWRGARPPDESHPFGYGLEAYFWTFMVGLLIFIAGGLASIYEGIEKLRHPEPLTHVTLSVAVLALCMVFEIASLAVALRQSDNNRSPLFKRRQKRRLSIAQVIHVSPDPGIFEVLAEDVASIIGLLIAFAGVAGSAWLGWLAADGWAAIAIGLLLMLLAGVIVAETHSLLTGEGAARPVVDGLREIMAADPRIESVCEILTMFLGPNVLLVAATLSFRSGLSGEEVAVASDEICAKLRAADKRIQQLFLRPGLPVR
ncbi:MAG: cation transporter [Alphaproteobacteria bacterium]|nr:cation transporter [Alphaproteobacteria bacterium]MDB5740471.1 cation transporter [Alphaproteobacteria bacterium]